MVESWGLESTQQITWASTQIVNVKIELTIDNGINWSDIIVSTPAAPQTYTWVVSGSPSSQCKVRISDLSNPSLNDLSNGTFNIASCSYSILPTTQSFGSGGGTNSVSVTAPSGCAWTAVSNDSWITLTSGSSGNGDGTANYSVASNPSTSARSGTITITGGNTFTVSQSGTSCTYSILPTTQSFGSGGGTNSVSVTAPSGCAWTAVSNHSWITITSGGSGSGNGTVNYLVASNPSTSGRTGTITITGGNTFTVNQAGTSCTYSISPTIQLFGYGTGTNSVSITAPNGCAWTATSNQSWITVTSGNTGSGPGSVNYSVSSNPTTSPRTGTISITGGNTLTVTQDGAPVILVSPANGSTISGPPFPFTWQAVSGAGAYQLKLSLVSDFTTTIVNTQSISGGVPSYSYTSSLSPGVPHYWQVRAYHNSTAQWGIWSLVRSFLPQSGAPPAPTNLRSTSISTNSISLAWTAPSGTVSGYKLYGRQGTSGSFNLLSTQTGTSFTHSSLLSNTLYQYYVRAYNNSGDGDPSSVVSVTTNQIVVPAPQNVIVSGIQATQFTISWSAVTGATAYKLYYKRSVDVSYYSTSQFSNPAYLLPYLQPLTTYQVYATTFIGTTESNPSNIQSTTTTSLPSEIPIVEIYDANYKYSNVDFSKYYLTADEVEKLYLTYKEPNTPWIRSAIRSAISADGVSKVIIRIEVSNQPSGMEFILQDGDVTSTERTGTIAKLSLHNPGSEFVELVQNNFKPTGTGKWYALILYTPPVNFVRTGFPSDNSASQRNVSLMIRTPAPGIELSDEAITLVRPPIVFVHGIWSDATAWKYPQFVNWGVGPEFFHGHIYKFDYGTTTTDHFNLNADLLEKYIEDAVFKTERNLGIACSQADFIGHSMGGLISRIVAACVNDFNFRKGYAHKLLTIATPHYGTHNFTYILTPSLVPYQATGMWCMLYNAYNFSMYRVFLEGYLSGYSAYKDKYKYNRDSWEDLSFGSEAIEALPNINDIAHSIVIDAEGEKYFDLSYGSWIPLKTLASSFCVGCLSTFPDIAEIAYGVLHGANDYIVSTSSQQGGNSAMTLVSKVTHTDGTKSEEIGKEILGLVNSIRSSPKFSSLPKPGPFPDPAVIVMGNRMLSGSTSVSGDSIQVKIANVQNPVTINPGSNLDIIINIPETTRVPLVVWATPFEYGIDTSRSLHYLIQIPYDAYGAAKFYVSAIDSFGNFGMDSLSINIDPSGSLVSIKIISDTIKLSKIFTNANFEIEGQYNDGLTRNITSNPQLQYVIRDTSIATFDLLGRVIGKRTGTTVLVASVDNLRDSSIIVVNRPPLVLAQNAFESNSILKPDSLRQIVFSVSLRTDEDSARVAGIRIDRSSDCVASDSEVTTIYAYLDADTNHIISVGDTLLGSANFLGGVALITCTDSMLITTNQKHILFSVDVSNIFDPAHSLKLEIQTPSDIWSNRSTSSYNFPISSGIHHFAVPGFSASPRTKNIGFVPIGSSKTDSVAIKNIGYANLIVSSIISTNSIFSVPPTTLNIAQGESAFVRVTYSPMDSNIHSTDIIIIHNAFTSPDTIIAVGYTPMRTSLKMQNGWNLISLPVEVSDGRTTNLFPTAMSNAFTYDGSYRIRDTLHTGVGYWLKFPDTIRINFVGVPITDDTVAVAEGWNIIGSISQRIIASSISSIPSSIVTSNLFAYNGGYTITDTICPGKGYWVKVDQSGSLILSSHPPSSFAAMIKIVPTSEKPPSPPTENTQLNGLPKIYALDQAYPNPFNPITTIKYQLPVNSQVTLRIYNILGQEVKTLVDEVQDAGYKSKMWNSTNSAGNAIASGVYFYRLEATSVSDPSKYFTQIRKMVVIK